MKPNSKYNWQLDTWPNFRYDSSKVQDLLYDCVARVNLFAGSLRTLPDGVKQETIISFMVSEAIKSSEIEGEYISREDVLSSIRNHLGLDTKPKVIKDIKAQGISKVMVDAYNTFNKLLSKKQLDAWHAMLFEYQLGTRMTIGAYRCHKEPMQVISGHYGKVKIHFEAPPSKDVSKEMKKFIQWFNETAPGKKHEIKAAPIRAALVHLYFESIHPYEDGNGRIGRALSEKALAQGLGAPVLLCLSQEIEANKKLYYLKLEQAQRSNDVTEWLEYFIEMISAASVRTSEQISFTIDKSKFYDRFKDQLNPRQTKVINRMLQEGDEGFLGGMNARKYVAITKCSKATATRDLTELLTMRAVKHRPGAGRSVSYDLNIGSAK